MQLIGQYDSPFVRRVGIALRIYEIPFVHQPWSTFGEADKIKPYNPLHRVPTLVLDDGDVIADSHLILDYLDSLVPAERAMFPRSEPARHRALAIAGLATSIADKAVSMFYEKRLHAEVSKTWIDRCRSQVGGGFALLESKRGTTPYWFGDTISHVDIAVASVMRFIAEAHANVVDLSGYSKLGALAARCEALPVFAEIQQPFIPPA
jgi:glutathione S-transferase